MLTPLRAPPARSSSGPAPSPTSSTTSTLSGPAGRSATTTPRSCWPCCCTAAAGTTTSGSAAPFPPAPARRPRCARGHLPRSKPPLLGVFSDPPPSAAGGRPGVEAAGADVAVADRSGGKLGALCRRHDAPGQQCHCASSPSARWQELPSEGGGHSNFTARPAPQARPAGGSRLSRPPTFSTR